MENLSFNGNVKVIGAVEQISDKFKKRSLVVTIEGQYPQHIEVQAVNDRVVMFDNLLPGDAVTCHINLRGREWQDPKGGVKYFNTLECLKLDKVG